MSEGKLATLIDLFDQVAALGGKNPDAKVVGAIAIIAPEVLQEAIDTIKRGIEMKTPKGGTTKGTKINPNKGAQGGKSWSQQMVDKHGSSGHTASSAIGDPDDYDGIDVE